MGLPEYMAVCSMGYNRSPTCAEKFREMAKEDRGLDIEVGFMGLDIEESELGETHTRTVLNNVKIIFAMDERLKSKVVHKYHIRESRVVNLDISDDYDIHGIAGPQLKRMLEKILEEKLRPYVDVL